MNQQNVDFLKDRLFFLGFGDNLHKELEIKLAEKPDKFTLSFQGEFGKDDAKKTVDYTLDLSKSKKEDMYFLNNYTATLKNQDPAKERSQKFFLNNGSGVTAKEAFNLLEGRGVNKTLTKKKQEGAAPDEKPEKYNVWMQLNFEKKDDYGNNKLDTYSSGWKFDFEKSLAKHPIKELKDDDRKEDLLKSLKKGNLNQVTFTDQEKERKMYISSNPRERAVNVYDENMVLQGQGIRRGTSESKSESEQVSQDSNKQKQQNKDEGKSESKTESEQVTQDGSKQKQQNKGQGKSDDGPEKSPRRRKGMSVH